VPEVIVRTATFAVSEDVLDGKAHIGELGQNHLDPLPIVSGPRFVGKGNAGAIARVILGEDLVEDVQIVLVPDLFVPAANQSFILLRSRGGTIRCGARCGSRLLR
jgi:hypothetical protein